MNKPISILIVLLALFSCEKDEFSSEKSYSSEINFDVSEWILEGRNITCVDFDKDGNAWIASGSELIFYNNGEIKSYDVGAEIKDLSIAPNRDIWLGTREGLARFSGGNFKFYTTENSGLPRNYTHSVEAAPNGKVWFCSAAHDLGGLMNYDGKKFNLFSPDNSILNQHVIQNLKIDKDNNVYFNTSGKVGMAEVFKVTNNSKIESSGGDDCFYWISALDINSKGEIFVAVDYSLSSYSGNKNHLTYFNKKEWKSIEIDFDFYSKMFIDKRDFIWSMGEVERDYLSFFVFDGNSWHRSKKGQIPEIFIKSVKVDNQNNIWFCTEEGIFILNQ